MQVQKYPKQIREFLAQLCRLAGEDPERVKSITIHAGINEHPTVTIERLVKLPEPETGEPQ